MQDIVFVDRSKFTFNLQDFLTNKALCSYRFLQHTVILSNTWWMKPRTKSESGVIAVFGQGFKGI